MDFDRFLIWMYDDVFKPVCQAESGRYGFDQTKAFGDFRETLMFYVCKHMCNGLTLDEALDHLKGCMQDWAVDACRNARD